MSLHRSHNSYNTIFLLTICTTSFEFRAKVVNSQISLTPPLLIKVPVPNKEFEQYICVRGIDFACVLRFFY